MVLFSSVQEAVCLYLSAERHAEQFRPHFHPLRGLPLPLQASPNNEISNHFEQLLVRLNKGSYVIFSGEFIHNLQWMRPL